MDKKIYITTPLYYVNDIPHIGHAYTTIAADVLSRYYKSQGKEVFFLTGTDEHGAKIAEAAEKAGKKPKEFVDSLATKFENTWQNLNIQYDEFLRTTNPKHQEIVKDFVNKLKEKGFIEKKKYEGLYCVGCERFLNKDELVDGKCPDHDKEPIKQSEENYFFLLSKFEDKLKKAIDKGDYKIAPEGRKNEVLGKLDQGLEDVSISRAAVEWGVPFPGDSEQTIYVWIDALINYYSAQKMFDQDSIWPPDIHLMAKDILWFHAIVWPALLMALGIDLPKKIFAHGFFTIDGKKMSKSLGNVLDPNKMVEKYGADAVRYALLREFPFGEDGDISEEKMALRYQKDLANGLGNLLQRTISMINKYDVKIDSSKKEHTQEIISRYPLDSFNDDIKNLKFDKALQRIVSIAEFTNKVIDDNKPWKLAKSDKNKLKEVLQAVFEFLKLINERIQPFMPETAEKMEKQLETLKPEPLFPRLDN